MLSPSLSCLPAGVPSASAGEFSQPSAWQMSILQFAETYEQRQGLGGSAAGQPLEGGRPLGQTQQTGGCAAWPHEVMHGTGWAATDGQTGANAVAGPERHGKGPVLMVVQKSRGHS